MVTASPINNGIIIRCFNDITIMITPKAIKMIFIVFFVIFNFQNSVQQFFSHNPWIAL